MLKNLMVTGALSIQSADKTGQSLLSSGIEESTFIKCKETEGSGVSTLLQRTFEKFNYVLSCYEHLQMEAKRHQRQTKSFDLNIAVDEKSMPDASTTSTLQSGQLEESIENFQSISPPNDLATYKSDKNMLEAPQVEDLAKCKGEFKSYSW